MLELGPGTLMLELGPDSLALELGTEPVLELEHATRARERAAAVATTAILLIELDCFKVTSFGRFQPICAHLKRRRRLVTVIMPIPGIDNKRFRHEC